MVAISSGSVHQKSADLAVAPGGESDACSLFREACGSPSHGENRGSSPPRERHPFQYLRLADISNFSPIGGAARREFGFDRTKRSQRGSSATSPIARSKFLNIIRVLAAVDGDRPKYAWPGEALGEAAGRVLADNESSPRVSRPDVIERICALAVPEGARAQFTPVAGRATFRYQSPRRGAKDRRGAGGGCVARASET
jgi:hypothetical protein